jgi:hypothetical protein
MEAIAENKATRSTGIPPFQKIGKQVPENSTYSPPGVNLCKSSPFQFETEPQTFLPKSAVSPHPIRYTGNRKNKNARDHAAGVFIF